MAGLDAEEWAAPSSGGAKGPHLPGDWTREEGPHRQRTSCSGRRLREGGTSLPPSVLNRPGHLGDFLEASV